MASRDSEEAGLYYLYLMSDGKISPPQKKLFDEICQKLGLSSNKQQEIIATCKDSLKSRSAYEVIVGEKLAAAVADGDYSSDNHFSCSVVDERGADWKLRWSMGWDSRGDCDRHVSLCAGIIWNLVKLGYTDPISSDNKKHIIAHLLDKWEIAPEVYQEMLDIADTVEALRKQMNWAEKTLPPGSKRESKLKSLGEKIEKILADAEITINELAEINID